LPILPYKVSQEGLIQFTVFWDVTSCSLAIPEFIRRSYRKSWATIFCKV